MLFRSVGDLYSRESCSQCPAKDRLGYYSDITLGDLWGASECAPQINCSKGASLVIVHTQKGAKVLNDIFLIPVEINRVIEKNPRYRFSHTPNRDSKNFWRVFKKKSLQEAYRYIYQPNIFRKIKLRLRR